MPASCIEAPIGTFSSKEIELLFKSTFILPQIEIQNYFNPILNLDQNSTSCHLNESDLFPWISAWQVIPNFGQNYLWYTIIFSFSQCTCLLWRIGIDRLKNPLIDIFFIPITYLDIVIVRRNSLLVIHGS